ncbi:MAG: hypothetical protein AAFP78_11915, partial [Pseudomonadota bacterium]
MGSADICEFLREQNGEFLFNFMSEHINRYPDFDGVSNAYAALLADGDWRTKFDEQPSSMKNEERS